MSSNYEEVVRKIREAYNLRKDQESRRVSSRFSWIKEGKTVVRFLPPLEEDIPEVVAKRHFGIGDKSIFCLRSFDPEAECPVCSLVDTLFSSDEEEAVAFARRIKAIRKYFAHVVIRGEEEYGARIMEFPVTLWEDIVVYFFPKDEEHEKSFVPPFDPFKGRDFEIHRTKGKGRRVDYKAIIDLNTSPLAPSKGEIDRILSNRRSVTSQIKESMLSVDEINALLNRTDTTPPSSDREKKSREDLDSILKEYMRS